MEPIERNFASAPAEKHFVSAPELANVLGISLAHSYRLIRSLNSELSQRGYRTLTGRVARRYLQERFYGLGDYEAQKSDDPGGTEQ